MTAIDYDWDALRASAAGIMTAHQRAANRLNAFNAQVAAYGQPCGNDPNDNVGQMMTMCSTAAHAALTSCYGDNLSALGVHGENLQAMAVRGQYTENANLAAIGALGGTC